MSDLSWRFMFAAFAFVAVVSLACGAFLGAEAFARSCAIAPDAPRSAYTRPILRCELPPWWTVAR